MGVGGLGVEVGKVGKVGIRSGPVRFSPKTNPGQKIRSGPVREKSGPVRFGTKIRSGPKVPFQSEKSL